MSVRDTVSSHYLDAKGEIYGAGRFGERMEFGRWFQTRYFRPFCSGNKDLLDFGCATGLFLRSLPARRRIGVEVNPHCLDTCREANERLGIAVELHETLDTVGGECVDVVISNHALEHVLNPVRELNHMYRVLRPGGHLVLVTPFDDWRRRANRYYDREDKDHHLFTWSPTNLGNLTSEAGFHVERCRICTTAWSPKIFWVKTCLGMMAFKSACMALSVLKQRREVFCLAAKLRGESARRVSRAD